MLMYAQISLSLVVSHDEGSLGDQQWFLSIGHIKYVGSMCDMKQVYTISNKESISQITKQDII